MTRRFLPLALCVVFVACSDATMLPEVRELSIDPDMGLVEGVGSTIQFRVTALAEDGTTLSTSGVQWSSDDPNVATISGSGLATAVAEGFTTVRASLDGRSAAAGLEVFVPVDTMSPGGFIPGESYFGRENYVEFIPGTLPVVLSSGHGGSERPAEIPDRTFGVVRADLFTLQLTMAARDALIDLTGHAPHVVLSHLHRSKLDPNREIVEAAQGNPFAEQAWEEYHSFVDTARALAATDGDAMYFDMHGHAHTIFRLELGYLLSGSQLDGTDTSLNDIQIIRQSSIRALGESSPLDFSALLRGPTSFGGFLEGEGVASVPSPSDPSPMGTPYFTGGYSTVRHGSLAAGEVVSGIQIEHHYPGLLDSDANRRAYAERLARAIRDYMLEHMGYFEPQP
ncbi:MAG: Ig-like domain-containing protein [Gemmatimonadota bacterium]